MNEIEGLLKAYEEFIQVPWEHVLAGPEKVWFAIYHPTQERRLRLRLPHFEVATASAHHSWKCLDLTDLFARWMANHDYQEAYFEQPEDMGLALGDFATSVSTQIIMTLNAPDVDDQTVVALLGLASLFGFTYASDILAKVTSSISGRLLVFFPGQHNGSNYRLLDARDGWNYLATPISGMEGK